MSEQTDTLKWLGTNRASQANGQAQTDLLASNVTTCIQAIEAQTARAPDAVAVRCGANQVTYDELNRRANQLAHSLRGRGAQPEKLIGICAARSIEMVIGILGILKAGGAYVPLDSSYPRERLAFVLADAQIQMVVTQSELLDALPACESPVLCLDRDWSDIAQQPDTNPNPVVEPANLAYVIYTSGSTGKPKGVMITHANVANFVRDAGAALPVTANDIYLHTASIGYALSVRQLLIPLCYGATIVLATTEQARDPLVLFDLIKRERVTLMDVVPSFWRACIQALAALPTNERANLLDNHLRRIVSIGEPLMSDLPHKWRVDFGHPATLVNIFGQTETTGVVATFPIPADDPLASGIVSIGQSIPRTQLYILDANLQPVPPGTPGELCVSSGALARGYLNRPELTAAKFIPNPFNDHLSDRLYRTGDLACYRADGNIDFLGRGDYQVKIRGQRLELGEVEAVLSEHPQVQACVVMARGENSDDKYLVAYIVPSAKLTADALRQFMRQKVPTYMVPSFFVFLDALPLTPNGKIDRLALPDPLAATTNASPAEFGSALLGQSSKWEKSSSATTPGKVDILPRTDIERKLVRLWQALLHTERIGIQDNFFDLGGHSLLAVRLFAQIEQELGVRFPITVLFQAPTIASLAELIEHRHDKSISWSPVVPIRTGRAKPPFFGVHGQDGGVLFWRDVVLFLPADQPFYGVQAQGVDGLQPALTRIEEMAARYLEEIRRVQPQGPYYLGGFSMGGEIAFEMARQLRAQNERVALLVLFDTANPDRAIRHPLYEHGVIRATNVENSIKTPRYYIWGRKLAGHIRRLLKLHPRNQIDYLAHEFRMRVRRGGIFARVRFYRWLGKRLPDQLLLAYLRESHTKALQNYAPGKYDGKLVLFRASETLQRNPLDSPMGWEPLAQGGVEVYLFDSTHRLVDREYSAEQVAKQLNDCLLKAQAMNAETG